MNRRYFLQSLIAAGVAATVDVDRLLWTPGEKHIFIPRWTEAQRAQWIAFCNNRDEWLRWFQDDDHFFGSPDVWPPDFKQEILAKIAIGNARAKELGLDERLHRPKFRHENEKTRHGI